MEGHLSDEGLAAARAAVPILCVDIVPVRATCGGRGQVGLILREMPGRDEPVWCHLGGRVRRGEALHSALLRHLRSTISGADADVVEDPQPDYVMQWFPTSQPADHALTHGYDPRQHAVALVYALELRGQPRVQADGEALNFRWWNMDRLVASRSSLWPGSLATVRGALGAAQARQRAGSGIRWQSSHGEDVAR